MGSRDIGAREGRVSCWSGRARSHEAPGDVAMTPPCITAEEVRWAYRILLDREPETDDVVAEKVAALSSRAALRLDVLCSPEFLAQNPHWRGFDRPTLVIKELEEGPRIFVDLMDVFVGRTIVKNEYEANERAFVRAALRPGETAVDIGANIGLYSLLFAHLVGPTGRVYAFEPFPANAALLEKSIAENRFADRLQVTGCALGNAPSSMRLVYVPGTVNSGGAYVVPLDATIPGGHAALDVDVFRLDDLPLRHPIRFMKLDVEGAEPLVLEGARGSLVADRPLVLAEMHPAQLAKVSGRSPIDLVRWMDDLGFECFRLEGGRLGKRFTGCDGDEIVSVVFKSSDLPMPG